jgi:hypothetical protein
VKGGAANAMKTGPALQALAAVEDEDIPATLGQLATLTAHLQVRMLTAAARPRELELLTVDEAAELGRMPRRRLRSLARGKAWRVPVGRRSLLVEKTLFLRWLADQGRTTSTTGTGLIPAPMFATSTNAQELALDPSGAPSSCTFATVRNTPAR